MAVVGPGAHRLIMASQQLTRTEQTKQRKHLKKTGGVLSQLLCPVPCGANCTLAGGKASSGPVELGRACAAHTCSISML